MVNNLNALFFNIETNSYKKATKDSLVEGKIVFLHSEKLDNLVLTGVFHVWEPPVLNPGWNLVGYNRDVPKENWPAAYDEVWEWTGSKYVQVTDVMRCGKAYWVYCTE